MRLETKAIIAPDDAQGLRLDYWLSRRFPILSRSAWQQRIEQGWVLLNERTTRPARRLGSGDRVCFSYPMRDEPQVPTDIHILFEDADYLVVNKPAGLPVHPSGIYKRQTVVTLLAERRILPQPHLLHRLDRETSGVLILAKNRAAAAKFHHTLRRQAAEKVYLVAVEGILHRELDARGYIFRRADSRLRRQRFFTGGTPPEAALEARRCHTVFRPLQTHNGMTLLEATLHTGRMHQIRATLHSLGYPVVGDKLYGVDPELYFRFADGLLDEADWRRLQLARSALHCHRMRLQHPLTGADWLLEAPLPADMAGLFG